PASPRRGRREAGAPNRSTLLSCASPVLPAARARLCGATRRLKGAGGRLQTIAFGARSFSFDLPAKK
ncbi:MAG: hypothetical protein KDJ78_16045, partial [Rhodobacteraceae bacterium]|nr:hypothetical protein [Paracoccaceae bacterium]